MTYFENEFLPEINYKEIEEYEDNNSSEVIGDSECPCCGYITIPNKGDAISYICPVCMWEIDLFIHDDNEASDLNNELSLKKAKENYEQFGAVQKRLKKFCRAPKECEQL